MSAAWVLYVGVVGALLVLAARSAARAAATLGAPTRWSWAGALAALLVLAVVAPSERTTEVSLPAPVRAPDVTAAAGAPARWRVVPAIERSVAEIRDASAHAAAWLDARIPSSAARLAAAAWALASAVLVVLFVAVNVRLVRARRRWPTHGIAGVPVHVAPDAGPAAVGLFRPRIVVPRSLLELGDDAQRLIVAHEREHLRARDPLLLAAAWLAVAAIPWHPAVWYLAARLRLAIEVDCDARVLRGGARRESYGSLLIDMAARRTRAANGIRVGALALADGASHLERRILAMNGSRKRHATARGVAFGTLSALLVLAACEAKLPTSAEIASMDVASAQRNASEAGFMRTPANDRTDFFVDGEQVSPERARTLEARQIGSIEVVKSERPDGRDTIFVTTTARMPKSLLSLRASDGPDPLEVGETTMRHRVGTSDSTELMVAHVEGELARSRVGARAADGAAPRQESPRLSRMKTVRPGEAPLLLIDGRRSSEADLAALTPDRIASVRVYKRDAGVKAFGDAAARNGVVVVTTKAAKN
jgi:hypothetical protein